MTGLSSILTESNFILINHMVFFRTRVLIVWLSTIVCSRKVYFLIRTCMALCFCHYWQQRQKYRLSKCHTLRCRECCPYNASIFFCKALDSAEAKVAYRGTVQTQLESIYRKCQFAYHDLREPLPMLVAWHPCINSVEIICSENCSSGLSSDRKIDPSLLSFSGEALPPWPVNHWYQSELVYMDTSYLAVGNKDESNNCMWGSFTL